MRFRRLRACCALVALPVVFALQGLVAPDSAWATTAPATLSGFEGIPPVGHVFLIIGENTDYDRLDTTNAPYLESTLRPQSAWLDNYYAATHWSQANYVALVTGQFTPCEHSQASTPRATRPRSSTTSRAPAACFPRPRPRANASPTTFLPEPNSYSVLRTLQDAFGAFPYLGYANQVGPLPISWQ